MSETDDIAKLTDEALNREIAEAIGLLKCDQPFEKPHVYNVHHRGGILCPICEKAGEQRWKTWPNFAGRFDASLATVEHGGFVGPVEKAKDYLPIMGSQFIDYSDIYDTETQQWLGVWYWLNYDTTMLAHRGPRKFAEDVLRALRAVQEGEKDA